MMLTIREKLNKTNVQKKLSSYFDSEEKVYCFYFAIVLIFYPNLFVLNRSYQEYVLTGLLWACLLAFTFFKKRLALVGALVLSFLLAYLYNKDQNYLGNNFGSHDRILLGWTLLFFTLRHFFVNEKIVFPKQSLSLVLMSSIFFAAGISKLLNSGLSWSSSDNIQNILMLRYIVSGNSVAFSFAQLPFLCFFAGTCIYVFQLGSVLICWFSPWLFCILSAGFLLVDYLVLDIRFFLICLMPNMLSFLHLKLFKSLELIKG